MQDGWVQIKGVSKDHYVLPSVQNIQVTLGIDLKLSIIQVPQTNHLQSLEIMPVTVFWVQYCLLFT